MFLKTGVLYMNPSTATLLLCNLIGLVPVYKFSGDVSGGATPDPVPNSEVKTSSADVTAGFLCGRVGHRQVYFLARFAFWHSGLFFIRSKSCGTRKFILPTAK